MYTNVNVNIQESQKEKLRKALAAGNTFSLRLLHADLTGTDVIAVTQSQLNKIKKAHEAGRGLTIKMSKSQVVHNMKVEGGILPLLAVLASQAIPFSHFYSSTGTGRRCIERSRQHWSTKADWKRTVHQERWICLRDRNRRERSRSRTDNRKNIC